MKQPLDYQAQPSAPPQNPEYVHPRIENVALQKANNPSNNAQNMPLNNENQDPNRPPPTYSEAAYYPPVYQSNMNSKPLGMEQPQQVMTYPQFAQPQQYNPVPTSTSVGNTYIVNSAPQPAVTVVTGGNCCHCMMGTVEKVTDYCCLVFLIVLAILTFPIGLIFLCFIPCTVRNRCSRCHRLN